MTKPQKKVTVLNSPAATGDGQSPTNNFNNIVTDAFPESNGNFETAADKEHP